MNKVATLDRIYIRDLNVNDVFVFPGDSTRNVVEYRFNEGGWTTIGYRVYGDPAARSIYSRVGMTTVDRLV